MGASGTVCGGAAPLGGQPCHAGWAGGFRLLPAPLCRPVLVTNTPRLWALVTTSGL